MDGVILSLISGLTAAGFTARRARPGMKIPRVTAPCEMVGLQGLTARPGGNLEAEVFVQVCSPRESGAEVCEREALEAAAAIAAGVGTLPPRVCTGGECRFDGAGDFTQRLTLTLPLRMGTDGTETELPGEIIAYEELAAKVSKWAVSATRIAKPVYAFGEKCPVGMSIGQEEYVLELEGIIPSEGWGTLEALEEFSFRIQNGGGVVVYEGCTWRTFTRRETEQGVVFAATAAAVSRREE